MATPEGYAWMFMSISNKHLNVVTFTHLNKKCQEKTKIIFGLNIWTYHQLNRLDNSYESPTKWMFCL